MCFETPWRNVWETGVSELLVSLGGKRGDGRRGRRIIPCSEGKKKGGREPPLPPPDDDLLRAQKHSSLHPSVLFLVQQGKYGIVPSPKNHKMLLLFLSYFSLSSWAWWHLVNLCEWVYLSRTVRLTRSVTQRPHE